MVKPKPKQSWESVTGHLKPAPAAAKDAKGAKPYLPRLLAYQAARKASKLISPSASRQSLPTVTLGSLLFWTSAAIAQTNSSGLVSPHTLPDAGPSLLRVIGALVLVIGLFLGCVWVFRNGRQFAIRKGRAPRLNILEVRSLGARQAIYVVGYEQQRFLLGSTPAGINLLSHLPNTSETEAPADPNVAVSFSQALAQVLRGQPNPPGGAK
jgi:flagellar biosynthetic protein FliO